MSNLKINPQVAYFIKLGRNGEWEKDCLEESQTLRLGYNNIPHNLCIQGKWEEIQKVFEGTSDDTGVATRHKNQVRIFYESNKEVLWITFFGDKLFWCFSKPEITVLNDKSKIRPVIGRWSSNDILGKPLDKNKLSGTLLSVQGFRGTICKIKELRYLIDKINGVMHPEIQNALNSRADFEGKIENLISKLTWKDFELLVDLLFRQGGWQRISALGGKEKTIDLDLYSPITNEKILIQVKSRANLSTLKQFEEKVGDFQDYDRVYFLVHTPSHELIKSKTHHSINIWSPNDIAKRVVMLGLAEWVINKVSPI